MNQSESNAPEQAEWAAEQLWTVIRTNPGEKTPAEHSWKSIQFRSPEKVARLWSYGNYGVAVVAGDSGLVCIDVDPPEGEESLAKLFNGHEIPATLVRQTPRGGMHVIFKVPRGKHFKSAPLDRKEFPGIDIKCDGGYFILYDPERPYTTVKRNAPTELPGWLAARLPEAGTRPSGPSSADGSARAGPSRSDITAWINARPDGKPCAFIRKTMAIWNDRMVSGESLHDAMVSGVHAVIGDSAAGHAGLTAVLKLLNAAYTVTAAGHRPQSELAREWRNAVEGDVMTRIMEGEACRKNDPCKLGKASASAPAPDEENEHEGVVTLAREIEPLRTYWAWAGNSNGRIPVGELSLVAGHGEVGKSQFSIHLISRITTGMLPGCWFGVPRFCLIAASEDDWGKTIVPRLIAAGADLSLVGKAEVKTATASDGEKIILPRDYDALETMIRKYRVAFTFFDSVVSALSLSVDANKGQDVRSSLEPLARIARRTDSVINGNLHFNKNNTHDAMARMNGSIEFRNVARSVVYMAGTESGEGVISKAKNNLGASWPSVSYRIVPASIPSGDKDGPIGTSFLELTGETELDAGDIISGAHGERKASESVNDVIAVLQDLFAEDDEWPSAEITAQLKMAGASVNARTLKKAREMMGIKAVQVKEEGKRGAHHYVWRAAGKKRLP